jgi:hypothetical protein
MREANDEEAERDARQSPSDSETANPDMCDGELK